MRGLIVIERCAERHTSAVKQGNSPMKEQQRRWSWLDACVTGDICVLQSFITGVLASLHARSPHST